MTTGQQSPAALAEAAYTAVRALNHATLPGQGGLADHQDLYLVLGSLAALLHATPHALDQAGDWIAREQQQGRVGVDGACPASPATTVGVVVTALSAAADAIVRAARRVDHAHEAAAHLIVDL